MHSQLSGVFQERKLAKAFSKLSAISSPSGMQAGLSEVYFRNLNSYLCGYSHSSCTAAMQVSQGNDLAEQSSLSLSMFGVMCLCMARFAILYASLFASARAVLERERRPAMECGTSGRHAWRRCTQGDRFAARVSARRSRPCRLPLATRKGEANRWRLLRSEAARP